MAPKKSAIKSKKTGKGVAKANAKAPVKATAKAPVKTAGKHPVVKAKGKMSIGVKKEESEASKSYKELITEALLALKERKGSSRPALKKYIKDKYPKIGSSTNFDLYFNNAIKKGVETKDFDQPRGPSGTLKLVKKSAAPAAGTAGTPSPSANTATAANGKSANGVKKTHEKVKQAKKAPSPIANPTYRDMILAGLLKLNDGKGSSRIALKKFVKDQFFPSSKATSNFDHLFNSAIKKGVETGAFAQPKGPSGLLKKGKGKPIMQKITA